MAQYDIVLIQNTSSSGVDYEEKIINLNKGDLLSAIATTKVPTVLSAGTNGYILSRDDAEATGLKWISQGAGHTQNTDIGTTNNTFTIDNDSTTGKIVLDVTLNTGEDRTMTITNAIMTSDVTLTLPATTGTIALTSQLHTQGTDIGTTNNTFTVNNGNNNGKIIFDADNVGGDYSTTIQNATQSGSIVLTLPTVTGTLATESYVNGLFASNDAMLFKGTIGTGGTHTITEFNALTTYNAGWTYRVIEAGTIRNVVCQIGDLVMVTVDRAGSGNSDSDFTVSQTNIDGAVVGPASVSDGYVALFDGTTGKLLKAGTGTLGSGAYAAAYVHPTTNGNIHIPSDGSSTQILQYSSAGTAKWITLSGDVGIADAGAVTIANGVVSLAKMSNLAQNTIIGRITASTGVPEALTMTNLRSMLVSSAPATKTSTGTAGMYAYDSNYFYQCVATDTWRRTTLAQW